MKLRLLLVTTCFLFLSINLHAQNFEVPQNVSFKEKEDYTRHEQAVIAAAKWLETNKIGEDMDKRTQINAFVVQWVTGSPTVSISIDKYVMDLTENNPHLLVVFLAGYSSYVLENNYTKDKVKSYTAAVQAVINCYQLGGDLKRSKPIEKAIEKSKNNKLEEWVASKMQ
jgi:hypothetical protein